MATTVGFWLSGLLAVFIIVVGARFLLQPYASAQGFGVSVSPDPSWSAYLSVKAVRDIASGLFVAILIVNRQPALLGWFVLVATLIPVVDGAIVLRHGGTRAAAFGIHGATAFAMLVTAGLLLWPAHH